MSGRGLKTLREPVLFVCVYVWKSGGGRASSTVDDLTGFFNPSAGGERESGLEQ